MAAFERKSLREVLGERGYIRGPFGSALVRGELQTEGIPVYEQQHAITGTREFRFFISDQKFKELSRFQVRPNDLIISCSGTIGRISVIQPGDPMGIISQALLILRPHSRDLLPEFLYYFLSTSEGRHSLVQASHGSVQVNIAPRAVVEQIELPVPTLPEQRAIAHILGTLDEKIELNRRMNETLEGIAYAIFKSWFVDFDPVRAKMEGGIPPGLSAEIADLFPDAFSESELGSIPKGWQVRSLGEWVDPVRGRSYRSVELQDSRTALVTLKSFQRGGGYRADGLKAYTGFYKPEQVVTPGEVAVACTDVTQAAEVIGRPAIVDSDPRFDVLVASLDVLIARVRNSRVGRPFVYLLLGGDEFASHTYAHTSGTTVLHLDQKCVPAFRLAAPPDHVLAVFNRMAEPVFAAIAENKAAMRTLGGLRDTLLPRLTSGDIRVKNAERLVESTD